MVDIKDTQGNLAPNNTEQPKPETPKWFEGLPESLKTNKVIQKYDSQEKALEALVHSNKLLGKRIETLGAEDLGKHITPEQIYEIAKAKGMPESPDSYTLTKQSNQLSEEQLKVLREKAYNYQIKPDQLEDVLSEFQKGQQEKYTAKREEWRAETLNKYGASLEVAQKFAKKGLQEFGGDPLLKFFDASGLGDHPLVVEHFEKLGRSMTEDKIPANTKTSTTNDLITVRKEIKDLINDPAFRQSLKNDQNARDRLDALYVKQLELEKR